jgi:hypothetical protein
MARVFKARQLALDRIVAIKVMSHGSVNTPDALSRFKTEAHALARLNHASIVHIYDAGDRDGIPYCVMEFVNGRAVGDFLEEHRQLGEKEALDITLGVARALAHAWNHARIIHCDIKPDNILIDQEGMVKVTDLGLARILSVQTQDAEEQILGTPNYASPEQVEGDPDLDCRSDIYSLGATLYHMVTGALPFRGSPGSSAMERQLTDFLQDPVELNPSISHGLAWLIEKMMVKDRASRLQTWEEVIAALEDVSQGKFPAGAAPEPGASTVLRAASRKPLPTPAVRVVAGPRKKLMLKKDVDETQPLNAVRKLDTGKAMASLILIAAVTGVIYTLIFIRVTPSQVKGGFATAPQAARNEALPDYISVVEQPAEAPRPPATAQQSQRSSVPGAPPAAPRTATSTASWNDPDFHKGAKSFNDALALYQRFQKNKGTSSALPQSSLREVEQGCRTAIQVFERCKPRAPDQEKIDEYIANCYHLISDARHSSLVSD